MSKFKFVRCAIAFLTACAFVSSCNKEVVLFPEIKFDSTEISLLPDGGSLSVAYSIENATEGSRLVASTDAEWLKVSVKEDKIVLDFDMNKGEEARVAEIAVYYPEAEQVTLVATQEIRPEMFEIEIKNIVAKSVDIKITPVDEKMKYILFTMDKESFSKFKSDEEIVADDQAFLQEEMEYAAYYGMTEQELLDEYTCVGAFEGTFDQLDPETDYVIYAYGVNADVTAAITKVVVKEFTTAALPPKQMINMTFDISVKEEANHAITYTIKATPEDQCFYAGIIPTEGTQGLTDDEIAEILWEMDAEENAVYYEMYWDFLWPVGEESATYNDLQPSTEYMVIAFGVDIDYGVISNVGTKRFTSPAESVIAASALAASDGAGRGIAARRGASVADGIKKSFRRNFVR